MTSVGKRRCGDVRKNYKIHFASASCTNAYRKYLAAVPIVKCHDPISSCENRVTVISSLAVTLCVHGFLKQVIKLC